MEIHFQKKTVSFILCMALVLVMAFSAAGCNGNPQNEMSPAQDAGAASDITVLGEGSVSFSFSVTGQDGNVTQFEIHTDQETVGEALLELNLIAGDEGAYGLYVKTVNHITADYDKDGKYWAFYIDGEYAATGVDSTPVTDGASYAFVME